MPQVKDKINDGWYVNAAKDADGKPRALSLGAALAFKPGQKRFLKGSFIAQSRATFQAFTKAMANGNLVPEGAKPVKVEPKVEVKVEEPPPVKVTEEALESEFKPEPDPEPVVEDKSSKKKKRTKKRD